MQPTENQRLKIFREFMQLTPAAISSKVGLKQDNYADIESGEAKVSADVKRHLVEEFSINIDWLESGEGPMILL